MEFTQGDKVDKNISKDSNTLKDNMLFTVHIGEVIGNIYDKNFRLDNIDKKQ